MPRPIRARIDLAALRHNHAIARRHVGHGKLWSVVKADAYGHGLLPAALALQGQTDGFALVEYEGAVLLREQGVRQPILMLEGIYQASDLALCADYSLTPALHSLWQVEAMAAAALPTALPMYLKLNTGMNRLGLTSPELRTALQLLDRSGVASSVSLMTHFADADEERGVAEQLGRFRALTDGLRLPISIANSAALLRFPETVGGADDWSRPGIMLYGASPMPGRQSADELGLKPVMTLSSEIIGIQHLQAGDRVGYGGTFTATDAMTIGVVACGYADGYPRHAPTGTPVLVNGERTRTLGRVSMDKLCVDLSGLKVGAGGTAIPVTLWGEGLPADEVATAAGTIAYELFCALAGRVDIEYVG
jgi:alanine racemase